jgi:chemotaxis methyl-accepting protein methylase
MDTDISELLRFIKKERGLDFDNYCMGTLRRRIQVRMDAAGTRDAHSYIHYLKAFPEEADKLLNALTIKVSSFFRNPLMFEIFEHIVLPDIYSLCKNGHLRIWSAGCARGEEPYSIAMAVKDFSEREHSDTNIFIAASDIDRDALAAAEKGIYAQDALKDIKKERLDRYFIQSDGNYAVIPEIKSMVKFLAHDITSDSAPAEGIFSEYDLIVCRNVLIYFNRELQDRVLSSLTRQLSEGGFLFLGESETLTQGIEPYYEKLPYAKIFKRRRAA